nr:MAG TPA: hypothetical protein [Caudoviricetes sp.]
MLQLFRHPSPFFLCLILEPCRTARGLFLRLWFACIKASLARISLKHLDCRWFWFSSSLCHCPHLPVKMATKKTPEEAFLHNRYLFDLCMVSIISSCSSLLTPMLASASRVPQSGQISVLPSALERAGVLAYLAPQRGHIRMCSVSLFMSCHLHCFDLCLGKVLLVKAKADVPLKACADIRKGRYSYLPFFMHDVHKALPSAYLPRTDASDIEFHFFFVIKRRISFVAVKCRLIRLRDFPYRHGNLAAFLRLNGKIGSRTASFKEKLIIVYNCSTNHSCVRASYPHLSDVQVAAISNVISFHIVSILSEGNTLLPP